MREAHSKQQHFGIFKCLGVCLEDCRKCYDTQCSELIKSVSMHLQR